MNVGFSGISTQIQPMAPARQQQSAVRFSGFLDEDAVELSTQLQERLMQDKLRRLDRDLNAEFEPGATGWDAVELVFILETEQRQAFQKREADYTQAKYTYEDEKWRYGNKTWSEKRRYRKNNGGKEPQPPRSPGTYRPQFVKLDDLMTRGGFKNREGLDSILETLKASGYANLWEESRNRTPNQGKYKSYQLQDNAFPELARLIRRRPESVKQTPAQPPQSGTPEALPVEPPQEERPFRGGGLLFSGRSAD